MKIKQINCVGCPKFCRHEDFGRLKRLIDEIKMQGYEDIIFQCAAGKNIVKKFNGNGHKNI